MYYKIKIKRTNIEDKTIVEEYVVEEENLLLAVTRLTKALCQTYKEDIDVMCAGEMKVAEIVGTNEIDFHWYKVTAVSIDADTSKASKFSLLISAEDQVSANNIAYQHLTQGYDFRILKNEETKISHVYEL